MGEIGPIFPFSNVLVCQISMIAVPLSCRFANCVIAFEAPPHSKVDLDGFALALGLAVFPV